MNESIRRKPPLPVVQSFLTCEQVYRDERTKALILVRPMTRVMVSHFPVHVPLAIFAEFTGGHGRYEPFLSLRDGAGQTLWSSQVAPPFEHHDPLGSSEIAFPGVSIAVPQPGRYTLALLLNGEEAAQRTMWFGPIGAFKTVGPA
jgi:hypothetical protein